MKNTINLMIFIGAVAVQALVAQQATLHPTTFTAQGVLRDADGRTLADDDYEMTFQIYGNENGTGTALWSETADVEVTNGVWTYTFGSASGNPLDDLDDDGTNYLKITVGTDALSPLTQISLSPFETLNVSAGGNLISSSGNVGIGTTSPSEKLDVDGNIKLSGSLKYDGASNIPEIQFRSQAYGDKMYIGGGGKVVVGAGESGDAFHDANLGDAEDLILAADQKISLFTGANSFANRVLAMDIGADGNIDVGGNLDVDGNTEINGRLTINRGSDLFLKIYRPNQGWNYMAWYEGGNREAWMGMNNSGSWQLKKENGGEIFFTGADVNIYEDLEVGGVIAPGGFNATIYNVTATNFTTSSSNSIAQLSNQQKTFTLSEPSLVEFNFNLAMPGGSTHIVLQMRVNNQIVRKTIIGNNSYWGGTMTYSAELSAGSHNVKIYYRTPTSQTHTASHDWQGVNLQVIVYGS